MFLQKALSWSLSKALDAAEALGVSTFVSGEDVSDLMPEYLDRHKVNTRSHNPKATEQMVMVYSGAPKYLIERGFTPDSLRTWEIGYDSEAERVVIPVRDADGSIVGFSRRATKKDQKPKYLHLDFAKGQYLYGMHLIIGKSRLVVTEGQLDAIAASTETYGAVATMGSRVTKEQIRLMRGFQRLYLAKDMDRDGDEWTTRIGEALLPFYRPGHIKVCARYRGGAKDPAESLELGGLHGLFTKSSGFFEPYEDWRLHLS
jgi:hypothetical protein